MQSSLCSAGYLHVGYPSDPLPLSGPFTTRLSGVTHKAPEGSEGHVIYWGPANGYSVHITASWALSTPLRQICRCACSRMLRTPLMFDKGALSLQPNFVINEVLEDALEGPQGVGLELANGERL